MTIEERLSELEARSTAQTFVLKEIIRVLHDDDLPLRDLRKHLREEAEFAQVRNLRPGQIAELRDILAFLDGLLDHRPHP